MFCLCLYLRTRTKHETRQKKKGKMSRLSEEVSFLQEPKQRTLPQRDASSSYSQHLYPLQLLLEKKKKKIRAEEDDIKIF